MESSGNISGFGMGCPFPLGHSTLQDSVSHVTSEPVAESLALFEAVREELKAVCFESDSSQLIKAVNSRTCVPELYGVVVDIIYLLLLSNIYLLLGSLERKMARLIC